MLDNSVSRKKIHESISGRDFSTSIGFIVILFYFKLSEENSSLLNPKKSKSQGIGLTGWGTIKLL